MPERFISQGQGIASGTDKALLNLFNPATTPTARGKIFEILLSSAATPADQAAKFAVHRTTGIGTETSGFVPNNLDPEGPNGAYDSGIGPFTTTQPTETTNKQLLVFSLNQRATFRWVASPEAELILAAVTNNGADVKTVSSTSTQAHECTVFHIE